jgi:hypothetical protein
VKLRDYSRVGILVAKYGSEDVDDSGLQFLQATTPRRTSSKALNCRRTGPSGTRQGTLTSQTVWTKTSLHGRRHGFGFGRRSRPASPAPSPT